MSEVWRARCCANCANVGCDFHFRDAVLCSKSNKYRLHHECCGLFKMDEKEREG